MLSFALVLGGCADAKRRVSNKLRGLLSEIHGPPRASHDIARRAMQMVPWGANADWQTVEAVRLGEDNGLDSLSRGDYCCWLTLLAMPLSAFSFALIILTLQFVCRLVVAGTRQAASEGGHHANAARHVGTRSVKPRGRRRSRRT